MELILSTLFSENTLASTIRVLTLLVYGTMAVVINVAAGINNIGMEGLLLSGALVAVIGSWASGSWVGGMFAAMLWCMLLSVLFGYLVMKLKTNAILVGLAINLFASGGTVFVLSAMTGQKGSSIGIPHQTAPEIGLPFLQNIPGLRVLDGANLFTFLAIAVVVFVSVFIRKTPIGLRITAVGLNPNAASSVGINVEKIRYEAFLVSGAITGLGGAYLTMGYFSSFTRDMTVGKGFMCIAACNMGGATPLGATLAAALFAFANVFTNVLQSLEISVDLILAFPYIMTVLMLFLIGYINYRRRRMAEMRK